METVCVIGSNSFSGSDFIDLLLQDTEHQVVGVSRSAQKSPLYLRYRRRADLSRFEFHRLDLNRDFDALRELLQVRRPAYVINFAAQSEVAPSWEHPEQWFQTNAVSTAALANFLKGCDWLRRYMHISTPEVYGNCVTTVTEEAPFNPSTPYAASRAAAELMLQTLVARYGFPAVIVRSANVYGAHQQLHKIIPRATIHLRLGRTIELHGGGRARRSFVHIRDVSRGELAIMQRGATGQAYHLASDATTTIRDVVQRVCELAGADFDYWTRNADDRPGQDSAYQLDCTKARATLGWQAQTPLEVGLAEVIHWVGRNWDSIRSEPLTYVHTP
jgi:dTDP-glucose 4,6-dehydratase